MARAVADDVEARAAEGSSEWAAAGGFEAGGLSFFESVCWWLLPSRARLRGSEPVEDVLG